MDFFKLFHFRFISLNGILQFPDTRFQRLQRLQFRIPLGQFLFKRSFCLGIFRFRFRQSSAPSASNPLALLTFAALMFLTCVENTAKLQSVRITA